jgi:translation initiation factor IF-3
MTIFQGRSAWVDPARNAAQTNNRLRPISKPPPRKAPRRDQGPPINDRIRAPKIRVIDGRTGQQVGVMTPMEATVIARARGEDVVMISPAAQPPVCKIVNYGKYKYELAKHEKEKHKHKAAKVKEMKFRCNISPHDYMIKMTRAEDFLFHGDKLKVILQFRGRELAHPEIGMQLMKRVIEDFKTMAHVDAQPRQSGKAINMMLSPLPENKRQRVYRKEGDTYELGEDDSELSHEDDDDTPEPPAAAKAPASA